jgi:hypothetical protein
LYAGSPPLPRLTNRNRLFCGRRDNSEIQSKLPLDSLGSIAPFRASRRRSEAPASVILAQGRRQQWSRCRLLSPHCWYGSSDPPPSFQVLRPTSYSKVSVYLLNSEQRQTTAIGLAMDSLLLASICFLKVPEADRWLMKSLIIFVSL